MHLDKIFGKPVLKVQLGDSLDYDVMHVVWTYNIKLHTNKKKAQICGDGRPNRPSHKSLQKL